MRVGLLRQTRYSLSQQRFRARRVLHGIFFCTFLFLFFSLKKEKKLELYFQFIIRDSAFCQRERKFKWEQQRNRQMSIPRMIQVILMRFCCGEMFSFHPFFHFTFFFYIALYSSVKHYKLYNYAHHIDTGKKLLHTHKRTLARTRLNIKNIVHKRTYWISFSLEKGTWNEQTKANLINFETRK